MTLAFTVDKTENHRRVYSNLYFLRTPVASVLRLVLEKRQQKQKQGEPFGSLDEK